MKLFGVLIAIALLAGAAEQRIKLADLPAPVQKTVQEQTKNAQLHGLSKEIEHGKTLYEIETTVNGKSRDLLVDASGRIVEVEEATTLDQVPAAVQTALTKAGRILKIETVTKGNVISYEAVVSQDGKKREVALTADGVIEK
ncbi:MAG TPA: hypothetical protein VKT81_09335 [Bryobacteraceae bacterium]|nr:hypothetical protein [Bryobacteraceae bacterium]